MGLEAHLVVGRRRRRRREKCVRERGSGLAFMLVLDGWESPALDPGVFWSLQFFAGPSL